MLPLKNRLKKKKDFDRAREKGESFSGKIFVMKTLENNLEETRFGIVVSQKISKKAVVRNRIKRRLRNVLKNRITEIKKGYDVIFFTKKGIEEVDFKTLTQVVEIFLKKAKLI